MVTLLQFVRSFAASISPPYDENQTSVTSRQSRHPMIVLTGDSTGLGPNRDRYVDHAPRHAHQVLETRPHASRHRADA